MGRCLNLFGLSRMFCFAFVAASRWLSFGLFIFYFKAVFGCVLWSVGARIGYAVKIIGLVVRCRVGVVLA